MNMLLTQPKFRERVRSCRSQVRQSWQQLGLALVILILFIFFSVNAPNFLSSGNLLDVLRQISFVGVIACGMTLVIVAAEIDLSVGSMVGLSSALIGILASQHSWPVWLAALAALVAGLISGALAGAIRFLFKVPSFIVTLGLYSALRGLALFSTNAFPNTISSSRFQTLGAGTVAGIPTPIYFLAAVAALCWFVMSRTTFGRSLYAVGGNPEAARLSGISIARVQIAIFCVTGVLAALAGVLLSARLASGNPNLGNGYEFDAISAVIIGGTSLFGGRGSIFGTLLGLLFVGILTNGLVLLNISSYAKDIIRGVVVVVAVIVGQIGTRASNTA